MGQSNLEQKVTEGSVKKQKKNKGPKRIGFYENYFLTTLYFSLFANPTFKIW
jgi:hypothetical protein